MILPYRSQNPPDRFPVVTCVLIAINVIIFAVTSESFLVIKESVVEMGGLKPGDFNVGDMISSMFLHGDLGHLLGNMWFLYLFGFAVEGRIGWWRYSILYFLAGFAGDFLHWLLFFAKAPDIPSIGASGAIMGVLGAALFMFPFAKVKVFYYWGIWWHGTWIWPMWGIGLYYLGFDLLFGVLGLALFAESGGIGHFAHLGGAAGGFFIAWVMRAKRDTEDASEAKAVLDESKDFGALTRYDLEHLVRANPENSLAVHHWMHKSLERGQVTPECWDAFRGVVPKIMREGDRVSLGGCLTGLHKMGYEVSARDILECAIAAEKAAEPNAAVQYFLAVRSHPGASESDLETATYRLALVYEQWHKNYQGAADLLREYLHRWPMSPMAGVVQSQLRSVEGRLGGTV